jgi:hypothetical protein
MTQVGRAPRDGGSREGVPPDVPWSRVTFRLLTGLLGLAAVVTEIATLVERGTFVAANFFSYFTILTNVLVGVTMLVAALLTAAGRLETLDVVRGAAAVYALVVGIGFAVLLSGLEDVAFTAVPWDNVVLHYLVPAAVLVDLVLDPPRRRLRFVPSLGWLAFPLAYLAYSLVRGEITGWYPYPFLDPATDGVGGIALTTLALLVLGAVLTLGACRLSGGRGPGRTG